MEPKSKCKAVMSQGKNKGEHCWRHSGENGYCGKHQTTAAAEKAASEGLHTCSTHRCTTMLAEGIKYCGECIRVKEESVKTKTLCRGRITQGPKKGDTCDKQASTPEGLCGKHTLNVVIEKAASEGKRLCDDGKRACKNYTIDGKAKCEECLEIIREKERAEHAALRESGNCLGCGNEISIPTEGFRKDDVQRCGDCYEKMKETEKKRIREPRNYRRECKDNLDRYYAEYHANAHKRGLLFDLSFDVFCELVSNPCEYCGTHVADEVNGIDRVNNTIGYVYENSVPCCGMCNKMKSNYTFDEFKSHIVRIYEKLITSPPLSQSPIVTTISVPEIKNSSYKRPKEILTYYVLQTLGEYISLCEKDGRSPAMIEKIKQLSTLKLSESHARAYIKNVLKAETNSTDIKRSRIFKKEMFGYLKMGNVAACIDHYNKVHGTPEGFPADIRRLVDVDWSPHDDAANEKEFTRILVKYQNKRNS